MTVVAEPNLIECADLRAGYGPMSVLRSVDLVVRPGEVVALIGANGAGKTTTLLTLAGVIEPMGGEVRWLGETCSTPLFRRARQGMSLVTEERSTIVNLTTLENLRLAGVSPSRAIEYFPELDPLMSRSAGLLSGGEQQMLAMAKALGRDPRLLLADELSIGLAPLLVQRLLQAVRSAADVDGVGALVVEQHIDQALEVADRAYVMRRGEVVLEGSASELRSRMGQVESAYLGGTYVGDGHEEPR